MINTRKKVLVYGKLDEEIPPLYQKLSEWAEVYCMKRAQGDLLINQIKEQVRENGPFNIYYITQNPNEFLPTKINKEICDSLAPHCKLYTMVGAGYDNVDLDWIRSTGAVYANTPKEVGTATAQGGLTLLLNVTKAVTPIDFSTRNGSYMDLTNKTLDWDSMIVGVIGIGNIGSHVAHLLTGLGIKVVYTSRTPHPDKPYQHLHLEEFYKKVDVIVIACPLNESTRGMINKESIGKMKKGVCIVNIARGPIINEYDLLEAMESGQVLRCALDTFDGEPNIKPEILKNQRITVTGHCVAGFDVAGPKIMSESIENVIAFIKTGKPNTPVN